MKEVVYQLTGYLHSLRRLSKYNSDFWATHLTIDTTIEDAINTHFSKAHVKTEVTEIKQIDYAKVKEFFDKFIIQNLENVSKDQIDILIWDIVEYYGVASTSVNPRGCFNPLVSKGALEIYTKRESEFHESLVYFLVLIEDQAILTGFGHDKR